MQEIQKLKKKLNVKVALLCLTLRSHGLHGPWNSPGQNTGVGSCSPFQGIFPTQAWNPGLLHCRRILYQLSHKGSKTTLEWVAYPFSRGSSRPGIELVSPALRVDSLPTELSGKPMQEIQKMWVQPPGREDPLAEGMATHSSILAWRIPWTEEPSRLQSMESQRVGHD